MFIPLRGYVKPTERAHNSTQCMVHKDQSFKPHGATAASKLCERSSSWYKRNTFGGLIQ